MSTKNQLSDAQHRIVSNAVAAAELQSSGEIVTILADRSDGYRDIALAWAALAAILALVVMTLFPGHFLRIGEWVSGGWVQEWPPRELFQLAAVMAALKFIGVVLIQQWQPLKFFLIPGPIKTSRVHDRAVSFFKVGAERRTHGRTGILIYLSMREHRAEIVADEAIASQVSPEVWGDAMEALLAEVKQGRIAEGMAAAVGEVGKVLAQHFPRAEDDVNELPDRLIEV